MSDFVDWSKKDAVKIKEYLLANHKGELIKKSAIRLRFEIPYNRASLVFNILAADGWEVTNTSISVPMP